MPRRRKDREERMEQRLHALGTRHPACVRCGEGRWQCLELHHIAGRKHHDDTVILCRNCHRVASDLQRDHEPKDKVDPTIDLASIGFYLLGLCDLLSMLIETLRGFGKFLINQETERGNRQ